MTSVPDLRLNNGVTIPQLGFGVFLVPADEVIEPVATAIATGYRLIDTATLYGNEEGVGRAIADSGVPRDELFITTKVWNTEQGYDRTLRAFDESMRQLRLEVLDLYLIHWPQPQRDLYVETWRALERLAAEGRVRAIGVSNFTSAHLERLLAEADVVPAVNQVELHPGLPQEDLRAFHAKHEIVTEAWSPLGRGHGLLDNDEVTAIAAAHDRTPAQVVLRWHIQLGNVVIPKSVRPERIRENFAVFDFALTDAEMSRLLALDSPGRVGPDPDTFNST
ncbi:MAG: 2,5-diketo-D-gluconate reductase [Frankiaceae bacterium]|jgi:diketogulonate reductase-like aldo/keto reductase|nr:2,5-diketo-D-gluconate reductase [Frankiaceae bacterium]